MSSVAGKVEPQDIVFTSYGAIVWLPDLTLWAQTIAACLKPGGQFYMAEFHPAQQLLMGIAILIAVSQTLSRKGPIPRMPVMSCRP